MLPVAYCNGNQFTAFLYIDRDNYIGYHVQNVYLLILLCILVHCISNGVSCSSRLLKFETMNCIVRPTETELTAYFVGIFGKFRSNVNYFCRQLSSYLKENTSF